MFPSSISFKDISGYDSATRLSSLEIAIFQELKGPGSSKLVMDLSAAGQLFGVFLSLVSGSSLTGKDSQV